MKKMLVPSLLALALLTVTHVNRAQAWKEFRFSAGFDIQYRSGGNRFLWGLYESSPGPGIPLPPVHCPPSYASGYGMDGGMPYCPPQVGDSGLVGGGPGGWQGPAPKPEGAPGKAASASGAGYQQVGYYNYANYYNTGYYQGGAGNPYAAPTFAAPSYWYGQ